MDYTLRALSAILSYPTVELQNAGEEITKVIKDDQRLSLPTKEALERFLHRFAVSDIYELEEVYVHLFDRTRSLSLNLFEHVHGESRDRGGAMVSLIESYREQGLEPSTSELPDHLPVLLEYLAMLEQAEKVAILQDAAHIFEALRLRLLERESSYASAFAALLEIGSAQIDEKALKELLATPDVDPNDLDALDAIWEESEVRFGPSMTDDCPQIRDLLAQIDHPTSKEKTGGHYA